MTARYAALVLTMVLLAACGKSQHTVTPPPIATATPQLQAQQSPSVSPQSVCLTNPAPATNSTQSADFGYRVVTTPAANATVQSPLTVTGQANPFEGAYSLALFDAAGSQIAAQDYNKSNLQLAFTATLPFSVSAATPACVWVFERSGKDGSPINVTQIPVTLSP